MKDEKEYYKYLNKIKEECITAAAEDKEWALKFFDKAASPEHYYWENQQYKTKIDDERYIEPATEKQIKYATDLGIEDAGTYSKRDLSRMIDELTKQETL